MRVCLVAPVYMTGGQAVAARTLCEGFANDPRVHVEMQPIDPRIPDWIAAIRGLRTLVRLPLFAVGFIRRAARSHVIHVCSAAFSPFLLTTTPAILLGRLMGRPVILNYRDGRARQHLDSRWVRWVMRRASAIVVPSGFLADVFRSVGLDARIISNVVVTESFVFRARRPVRPILISSRSLEQLYAVENTLRAFSLVRAVRSDAELVLIGDGDQMPILRALVEQESIQGVRFLGALAHDQVGAWFDRADIFVNSSRIDNMPHSIIEAFSSGLPVVTTNAGGIPYIVEHGRNGLLVDVDRPRQMADAVLSLLSDGALAEQLVAEGQRDCKEMYSWEAARRSWTHLYADLRGEVDETGSGHDAVETMQRVETA